MFVSAAMSWRFSPIVSPRPKDHFASAGGAPCAEADTKSAQATSHRICTRELVPRLLSEGKSSRFPEARE